MNTAALVKILIRMSASDALRRNYICAIITIIWNRKCDVEPHTSEDLRAPHSPEYFYSRLSRCREDIPSQVLCTGLPS